MRLTLIHPTKTITHQPHTQRQFFPNIIHYNGDHYRRLGESYTFKYELPTTIPTHQEIVASLTHTYQNLSMTRCSDSDAMQHVISVSDDPAVNMAIVAEIEDMDLSFVINKYCREVIG